MDTWRMMDRTGKHSSEDLPEEVRELLGRFAPSVRQALGDEVVGIYLWGSATLGGYRAGLSDVDLLVLLKTDPAEHTVALLTPVHDALVAEHGEWSNRLEVAYVGTASLRAFRERPHPIARISPGEPLNLREADDQWLIDWYQVREHGIAVFGAALRDAVPHISTDELRAEARRQLVGWVQRVPSARAGASYLAYVVLVASRALYASEQGGQTSKPAAGEWIASSFPEWSDLGAHRDGSAVFTRRRRRCGAGIC